MKLKERIALWFIRRKIVAAYKKGLAMKPLPRWVGWIGLLAALTGPGGALAGLIPIKIGLILGGLAGTINSVTHSVNGTGGQPQ